MKYEPLGKSRSSASALGENLFILFNCPMKKKLGDVYTLPSVTAKPAYAYLSDGMHFGEVQRNHP